ncbi:MAG: fructosamine kinase family protein [Ignavibacteriales bacterium]|nr:fructosamine kinase family protein [Ignavibacteriales bacterium]
MRDYKQMVDLEILIGEKIKSSRDVSGGCIASNSVLTGQSGRKYFVKQYPGDQGESKAKAEVTGLTELMRQKIIRIPVIIGTAKNVVALEFVEKGRASAGFYESFGRSLAQLHRCSSKAGFGFTENNFIGDSLQINLPRSRNWREFYVLNRLMPQYKLMEKNGFTDSALNRLFEKMLSNLYKIIDDSAVFPSLLHGDLWAGNYFASTTGEAVIFDPAVYYGDRETDLAMTRLFGGFDEKFYLSYKNEFPLEYGSDERVRLYQLYHLMNHLNLFGSSYYREVIEIIKKYN